MSQTSTTRLNRFSRRIKRIFFAPAPAPGSPEADPRLAPWCVPTALPLELAYNELRRLHLEQVQINQLQAATIKGLLEEKELRGQ